MPERKVVVTSVNQLVGLIAYRARKLCDMKLDELRNLHPDGPHRVSRAECIEAILIDEYELMKDLDLEEPVEFVGDLP